MTHTMTEDSSYIRIIGLLSQMVEACLPSKAYRPQATPAPETLEYIHRLMLEEDEHWANKYLTAKLLGNTDYSEFILGGVA
ncbi:hypothetical protein NSS98_30840 [Paenibacillus sp. FSL E2-0274]|uniref:hypothetical protein n=1 Tax=Paenibacillus TaxID=44249 RepID=UPI00096F6BB5|nr:hypothetical protein [Paenibacillus odorifer]OMD12617.1 hypothetical protein BJP47_05195 [Paenibacillus odorifer]OME36235.1 hypothetical protein BSK63_03800 [Paenibacillus odorifer]